MPSSMAEVARAANVIAASGSPAPAALGYHMLVKPSASARLACSTSRSAVAPAPVSPIRMKPSLP